MAILFAILLVSFCALLWASLSIASHVRASRRQGQGAADATSVPAKSLLTMPRR